MNDINPRKHSSRGASLLSFNVGTKSVSVLLGATVQSPLNSTNNKPRVLPPQSTDLLYKKAQNHLQLLLPAHLSRVTDDRPTPRLLLPCFPARSDLPFIMERLVRPVSRQLLRSRPRYPFAVPPPLAIKRLYTMGHSRPDVSCVCAGR